MKFINFDNYIEKNYDDFFNKNCFVPQNPSNTIILGVTGCGRTNLLSFNLINKNDIKLNDSILEIIDKVYHKYPLI